MLYCTVPLWNYCYWYTLGLKGLSKIKLSQIMWYAPVHPLLEVPPMELTDSLQVLFMATARSLQGSARRLFMARTVQALGPGGPRHAARARGWSRVPIRQGIQELESGGTCLEACAARGR